MQSLDEFLGRDNEHLRLRPFQHDDENYDEIPSEPLYVLYFSFLIDLTDYSLLPNGLAFLRSMTEYNFVIGSKINKKQFCVGEYWNITFICTRHAKIH